MTYSRSRWRPVRRGIPPLIPCVRLIRPNSWYLLMPLFLGLTSCTDNRPLADASAAPSKSTAALMPAPEQTFESIPTPSELMERLRASLRDPVDTPEEQQALQEV